MFVGLSFSLSSHGLLVVVVEVVVFRWNDKHGYANSGIVVRCLRILLLVMVKGNRCCSRIYQSLSERIYQSLNKAWNQRMKRLRKPLSIIYYRSILRLSKPSSSIKTIIKPTNLCLQRIVVQGPRFFLELFHDPLYQHTEINSSYSQRPPTLLLIARLFNRIIRCRHNRTSSTWTMFLPKRFGQSRSVLFAERTVFGEGTPFLVGWHGDALWLGGAVGTGSGFGKVLKG